MMSLGSELVVWVDHRLIQLDVVVEMQRPGGFPEGNHQVAVVGELSSIEKSWCCFGSSFHKRAY